MKQLFFSLSISSLLFLLPKELFAQKSFPQSGVTSPQSRTYAFTNATIYTRFDQKLDKATLLIKDGRVVAVGQQVPLPNGAIEYPLNGQIIYPSFIDLYSNYGLPTPKAVGVKPKKQPQMLSNKKGAYSWNEALKPEWNAAEYFEPADAEATTYRKLGFGALLTHQMDGISRGSSTFVLLGKERAHEMILAQQAAHHLSFRKGMSTQNYPNSLMGIIALLRQTYLDNQWYHKQAGNEETNLSLEAWDKLLQLPQIFEVRNHLEAQRAIRLGKEFEQAYILKGAGDEYKRLNAFKNNNTAFIVPLNFPEVYDLSDPFEATQIALHRLQHWELAPTNPARLAQAGIPFALSIDGLKKPDDFLKKLQQAIQVGLTEEAALKALTHTPASLIGMEQQIGSLEKGKIANFIICSKPISDKDFKVHQNWIKGRLYEINPILQRPKEGRYELKAGPENYRFDLSYKKDKANFRLFTKDSTEVKGKINIQKNDLRFHFPVAEDKKAFIRLAGAIGVDGRWTGRGTLANGEWVAWSANYMDDNEKADAVENQPTKPKPSSELAEIRFPFGAYGWTERPQAKTYVFRNATIWTNEKEGILKDTDLLIRDGKIAAIGKDLKAPGSITIDATGKHLTAGIIDEHSHIAVNRGVNEGTQASSAEVRIGDVINPEDINIYRQLAGGVTCSQLLHGSANPIGGQSALIKLRWGFTAEEMKLAGADGFIKFALGENVKQSNWGDQWKTRFPQTRMGVEQVFEDYFTRAREYGQLKKSGKPYRKDLDLEALLEVIESKRFITCHSYQQGEINMLMKVAERHGFRVNTFTHVLEGYKIADKMVAHGAGGSTFSDWWAYKYEVIDAIPHNGALMHEQGVVTAFNSDDAEMGRRLNQEAAKAVQFGNVSEEEALKFVTLYPAKLLHIDEQVGSLKIGKDADVVLWSDHPLSIYAKAEKTLIDGILFFDREADQQMQQLIQEERARLVQKSLAAKAGGATTQKVKADHHHLYHCDHNEDEAR
ncbi:MAG: amidohydrolase family protein [Bacteroidota bacterium]